MGKKFDAKTIIPLALLAGGIGALCFFKKAGKVLYVEAGNAEDIQATIDECPSDRCTVIIPAGNYALKKTVYLKSNLKLVIQKGALIHPSSDADFLILTDVQEESSEVMIYSDNNDNIEIINKGFIGGRRIHINNAKNVKIYGGHVRTCYGIYNSENIDIGNIFKDGGGASTWQECTKNVKIHDIVGITYSGEGECVELNGYCQDIKIWNIDWIGGEGPHFTEDEAMDINASRNVRLDNIKIKDARRLFTITEGCGIRFGTCEPIVGDYVSGRNLTCIDCSMPSYIGVEHSDLIIDE